MKKILYVLLILLLIMSLIACSNDNTVSEKTDSQNLEVLEAPEEKTEQEPEKKEDVVVVDENLSSTPKVEEKKEETPKTATIDPYDYLGKSESSFIDSLKNLGFTNVVKIDSIYSNYPEGTICYYLPDGEQTLDKTIEYKVSIGQKPVEKQEEVQEQQNNQEDITVVSDIMERTSDYDEDGYLTYYVVRTLTLSNGEQKRCRYRVLMFTYNSTTHEQVDDEEPTEEQWQNAESKCWAGWRERGWGDYEYNFPKK